MVLNMVRYCFRVNASGYNKYPSIRELSRFIGKLKPFTLYAFYVEAVTLNKKGARSSLKFLKTREMGKIGNGQIKWKIMLMYGCYYTDNN